VVLIAFPKVVRRIARSVGNQERETPVDRRRTGCDSVPWRRTRTRVADQKLSERTSHALEVQPFAALRRRCRSCHRVQGGGRRVAVASLARIARRRTLPCRLRVSQLLTASAPGHRATVDLMFIGNAEVGSQSWPALSARSSAGPEIARGTANQERQTPLDRRNRRSDCPPRCRTGTRMPDQVLLSGRGVRCAQRRASTPPNARVIVAIPDPIARDWLV